MADLNQAASGVLNTAIQSDAPSPVFRHNDPDAEQAVASVGKVPLGNAVVPLEDATGPSASIHGPARQTVQGTENGLERQIIAHDFTNQVLAYLVTGIFFALIVLLMFSTEIMPKATTDAGVKDLLFTLLGVVATGWANIIGFYFGSSAGSAQKSQTISTALLHGNPVSSPTRFF
jgi:hypothetical protein